MGTSPKVDGCAPIHVFASSKSWIEGNATLQLQQVAGLPGVRAVAAMPDLHPGKYGPVGCAVLADRIHPQLVGSDIGCGMGLFELDIAARKLRPDQLAERLHALDQPWDGDTDSVLADAGLSATTFDASLGSIGGGNHFCELQAIEEILAPDIAAQAGLDRDHAYVLVHSGSRGLGFSILERILLNGQTALDPASEEGSAYMDAHDHAVQWAKLNRRIIAERAAAAARADLRPVNDLAHNMVERERSAGGDVLALHRKGAAASDRGLVPVPGSRGTLSYLVEPLPAMRTEALASLAHGAGRKYDRGSMHGRVRVKKSDVARLERNPYGGIVVCGDRGLLAEEAPEAYKNIERVIADLVEFGLARVVATFRPLVTFKKAQSNVAPVAPSGRNPGRRIADDPTSLHQRARSGGMPDRGPKGCCNACGRSCFARARDRLPGGAEYGRAWSGLGHRRHPWRCRSRLRAAVDRCDPVGGAKPARPHHKRKNWFIGVFELPAPPDAPKALAVQDVRFEAFRAGGPGGQHQNKTESAVRATHIASGLSVVARDERSQHRNKALALERIAALLRLQGELQAITAQNDAHAAHDRLERGRPVKRFKGAAFQAS